MDRQIAPVIPQGTYPTLVSSWMTEEKDVNQQKIGRGN
jgi:hypothetical protein